MVNENPSSTEAILRSATPLFAELGYDGMSMDLLAASLGVDKNTVVQLIGSKRELYLEVMRRAYDDEMATLTPAIHAFTPDRAGLAALIDAYLDFCLDRPHVPALWMHRWLSDAADFAELEDLYVRPTHQIMAGLLADVLAPDVDVEYAVWTIVWSVHGFIGAQVRERGDRFTTEQVARLRSHLHLLADRLLRPEL